MPSPFPGMDPLIESQKWEDFHTEFISAIRAGVMPKVKPRYVAEVERRIYLQKGITGRLRTFVADAAVVERPRSGSWETGGGVAIAEATQPILATVPMLNEHREARLLLRRVSDGRVVTVIELLSPTNKKPGSTGAEVYQTKRQEILETDVHLIELDLLRGGQRPPIEPRPPGDYFAMVSRPSNRPNVELYAWPLWRVLPTIPVPLADGDPDVTLDLQAALDATYDRAGYDYAIQYDAAVQPPLPPADAKRWRELQESTGSATQ